MWLGEQITARGIGNGISLIIFAGIVANLPQALAGTLELGRTGALSAGFHCFAAVDGGCCDCVHSIHRTIPKKNYSSVS
jgi:preprotein translocase subunit SecY